MNLTLTGDTITGGFFQTGTTTVPNTYIPAQPFQPAQPSGVCPWCGHCSHCGRGGSFQPVYPPYWYTS